ncbi:hypothetical protein, partial [uncultured Oscillibacter sp.]|uniref:hypothetical protein n=1 Tax=uncultured Oscillibacter sp. TaxID=876091 RepID=UPI002729FA64
MQIYINYITQNGTEHIFEIICDIDPNHSYLISLPEPSTFSVVGHPAKQFLPSLRWYLEDYLQTPYAVYQQLAESVEETIQAWGMATFQALFAGYAQKWYLAAKRENFALFYIKLWVNLDYLFRSSYMSV